MVRNPMKTFRIVVMLSLSMPAMALSSEIECPYVQLPEGFYAPLQELAVDSRWNDILPVMRSIHHLNDPEIHFTIALMIMMGAGDYPTQHIRDLTVVRLMKKAALCGHDRALRFLSSGHRNVAFGLEANIAKSACLRWASRMGLAGDSCGLRIDERPYIVPPGAWIDHIRFWRVMVCPQEPDVTDEYAGECELPWPSR